MAALPPELRSRASRLVERFHLDAAGWFQADEPVPHLGSLSAAVWDGHLVCIAYERGPEPVERTLGPLGLVLKGGVWYVVGLVDGQVRTYRASRVVDAVSLDERFERPAGFDLAEFWEASSEAYERASPKVRVTVRVREASVERLWTAIGGRAIADAIRPEVTDPDDWRHYRLVLPWPDEAAGVLMGVGGP